MQAGAYQRLNPPGKPLAATRPIRRPFRRLTWPPAARSRHALHNRPAPRCHAPKRAAAPAAPGDNALSPKRLSHANTARCAGMPSAARPRCPAAAATLPPLLTRQPHADHARSRIITTPSPAPAARHRLPEPGQPSPGTSRPRSRQRHGARLRRTAVGFNRTLSDGWPSG